MKFGRVWKTTNYPYATVPEMRIFKMKIESGELTFFRIKKCGNCRKDTPQSKEYCSKECWEHAESRKKPKARK